MTANDDRHLLIVRYLDGCATAEEADMVASQLAEGGEFSRIFCQSACQVADLRELLGTEQNLPLGLLVRDEAIAGAQQPELTRFIATGAGGAGEGVIAGRRPSFWKRRIALTGVAASVAALLFAGWWYWTLSARASIPRLVEVYGTVHVSRADGAAPAAKGVYLYPAETISTDARAYARLRFLDGTCMDLAGDTEVTCRDYQPGKSMELLRGSVFLEVMPQAEQAPFVINPGRTDQVRVVGTKLQVASAGTKGTRIAVVDGSVIVGLGDRAITVAQEQQTTVTEESGPAPSRPLDETEMWFGLNRGLTATYFQNTDLTGKSVARIDPRIDFNWGVESPDPALDGKHFSARWTGYMEAPHSDDYYFELHFDDAARLFIDDRLVIDGWDLDRRRTLASRQPIRLVAGRRHRITIEYRDVQHHAELRLWWMSSSIPKAIIPQSQFYPSSGAN